MGFEVRQFCLTPPLSFPIRLNHIKLPTFDHFDLQKWQLLCFNLLAARPCGLLTFLIS